MENDSSNNKFGLFIVVLGLAWTFYGNKYESINHQILGYIFLIIASLLFIWMKIKKIIEIINKKR